MVVWAARRSVHHSRVDGNVMAVAERENSSLPLYLPIVHQPSRDSIRQPSDCKLVFPLTGYCQLAAYCYCCHFSVVSYDNISAWTEIMPKQKYLRKVHCCGFPHSSKREQTSMYVHTCSHTCVQSYGESSFFSPTYNVALFLLLPAELRFPQLFMSHLLGQVLCQMCVK